MTSFSYRPGYLMGGAIAAIMAATPVAAEAQEATYRFDIPAQDMAKALRAFGKAARQPVSFDSAQLRGMRSGPVSGSYTASGALRLLIGTSGLTYRRSPQGVLIVTRAAPAPVRQPASDVSEKPAAPQVNDTAASEGEAIVVTGSRVDRAGFEAPTPTTVVGETDLRQGARESVAAVLNDQPQFRATATPVSSVGGYNSGISTADLRGLGSGRTLTLLNGRRFTGSSDLNSVPMDLIKRVEVVTGGASAAWGSGAVAGVVNIILDDDLEGLRLGGTSGVSSRGDGARYGLSGSFGTAFGDDRGRIIVGVDYLDDKGIFSRRTSRPNIGSSAVYANPTYTPTNGQNAFFLSRDVNLSIASEGGLINNGVLAGQTFNSDGSLRPFRYGSPRGGFSMIGGEGSSIYDYLAVSSPYERLNTFARVTYDVGDARFWIDGSYGRMAADFQFFPEVNYGDLVISRDNAFLSDTVRDQLVAAGQQSFGFGRIYADMGLLNFDYTRENFEGAVGVDGSFDGGNWRYSAYYGHGEFRNDQAMHNLKIRSRFANAIDAVTSPLTGDPICRVALTDPTTACRPLNIFGAGNASSDALAYAFGTATALSVSKLDTAGASLRGDLFELWAGPVSVAFGAEARWEHLKTTVDSLSAVSAFSTINFAFIEGGFNVKEGFAEIAVPLLDIPGVNKLEFNGAARYSDYSTTGGIWSWKLGVTDRLFDDFLLRVTRSRDIRSPSILELFTTRNTTITSVTDGNVVVPNVFRFGGGNPNLNPEVANTLTVGGVWSPSFAPGLNLSVDFYKIDIGDVISSLSAQDIVNRCAAGNANLCDQIERDGTGKITTIYATFLNLARYKTSGVDFEASYSTPLDRFSAGMPGSLKLRALATYVDTLTTFDGQTKIEYAGDVGDSVQFGTPKWRGTGSISYESEGGGIDLRVRYVGGGLFNHLQDISNNKIGSRTYVDIGARVEVGDATIHATVNNLFDRDPPLTTLAQIHYDQIGRYFQIGAKIKF